MNWNSNQKEVPNKKDLINNDYLEYLRRVAIKRDNIKNTKKDSNKQNHKLRSSIELSRFLKPSFNNHINQNLAKPSESSQNLEKNPNIQCSIKLENQVETEGKMIQEVVLH